MNNDPLFERSMKIARRMQNILMRELKDCNTEQRFKIGSFVIIDILTRFCNAIVSNDYPEQKLKLVDNFAEITKLSLREINKEKENGS